MALDEPANFRRVGGEDGPALEERGAVAPSEPEEKKNWLPAKPHAAAIATTATGLR